MPAVCRSFARPVALRDESGGALAAYNPPMNERPPRMDARALLADVLQELFSLDRGVLFTLRGLLRSPGASVRRYVEWRDPRMVRPFRLSLGALAFAAVAFALSGSGEGFSSGFQEGFNSTRSLDAAQTPAQHRALDWLLGHAQWLLLLVWVPASAEAIGRAYAPLRLNLAEQCAIALYALVPPLLLIGLSVLLPLPSLPNATALGSVLVLLLPSLWLAWTLHRYARPEQLSALRMLGLILLQWLLALVLLVFAALATLVVDLFWL